MIPDGRDIPLGSIQIIRSRKQPKGTGAPWEDEVNVEVIRFRFTPGRGRFYGPPEASRDGGPGKHGIAVEAVNAFLDPSAGWFDGTPRPTIEPLDTYDPIRETDDTGPSLGVVDDTCEARVSVTLTLPGSRRAPLVAHANIFGGPPDFAPDRRPFLSLADELEDRGRDAIERNRALSLNEREIWVQDLFERIYETVSLFNLDHFQNDRSILLKGSRLRAKPIRGDHVSQPRNHAMTNKDKLRNDSYTVPARSRVEPLPLSEHARTRHRSIQDIDGLKELIAEHPGRLEQLIRRPFEVEQQETADLTTMRMPPFMRNSNAYPLTLSIWQHQLLMTWLDSVRSKRRLLGRPKQGMSPEAAARRRAVLARLCK